MHRAVSLLPNYRCGSVNEIPLLVAVHLERARQAHYHERRSTHIQPEISGDAAITAAALQGAGAKIMGDRILNRESNHPA